MIKNNLKQNFKLSIAVNLFMFLTLCFFSSMEVYTANYLEFTLPIRHVWWIMLSLSLAAALICSLLISLFSRKAFMVICLLIFSAGICFYVQSMFLNGQIQSFTGETVQYSSKTIIINLFIWLAIAAGIFFAYRLLGPKGQSVILFISAAMIVIQTAGLATSVINLPRGNGSKDAYLSSDGEFSLSAGENAIVFIVDTCDEEIVNDALVKYPDLFAEFNGFTYYPDMVSTFSRTFPSVPYLLTGEFCYFDKPFTEYIHDAWENESFIKVIRANQTDVRIYTEPDYLDPAALGDVDNYYPFSGSDLSLIRPIHLFLQMMHLSGYKVMPYLVKAAFSYTAQSVSNLSMNLPPDYAVYENDTDFLALLYREGLSIDRSYESAFRFYHLWGTHPGHFLTADLTTDPNASDADALRGCLKIISYYIEQMKQLGVYDSSTIIITADHASSENNDRLEIDGPKCCLLMVKEAGADDSSPISVSNAQVSHEELKASVLNAFSLDYSQYGEPFCQISDTAETIRHYYHSALYSDIDGEIALREYEIDGDARDFSNWRLTGTYWDINYSQRDVSSKRLSDIMQ